MAEAVPEHFEDEASRSEAEGFGLLVFLASESLLFAAPLAVYAGAYARWGGEFAQGATHNLGWFGLVGTALLLAASAAAAIAASTAARGRARSARWALAVAAVLGLGFLAGKGYEYATHIAEGMLPGGAGAFFVEHSHPALVIFTNLYWVTTGLHALHVIVGVGLLVLAAIFCRGERMAHRVELVAMFWHFVDLVWLVLWPLFYTVGGP